MSKYHRLKEFLSERNEDYIPMSFFEIEKVLKLELPASRQYPAWWSNNPSNNPMTKEWLEAGYETESVNIAGEKLVFRRVRKGAAQRLQHEADQARPRHPVFGFMKGLLTIEPGYDLTTPSSELWFEGVVTKAGKND